MKALGVESPQPRLFTRIANYLRPPVSAVHLSSAKASASSEREQAHTATKNSDTDDDE
jgi:hypothetical protein